jgi:hypothetical protein
VQFRGKDSSAFSQQRRLADARPTQQQQTLSRFNHVAKHIDGSVDGPADTTRQPDNLVSSIAKCGNAMEGSLYSRAIVFSKGSNSVRHVIEIFARDCRIGKINGPVRETRFRPAAKVQDDLNKIFEIRLQSKRSRQVGRHHLKQEIEVIRDFFTGHLVT